jgi:hypothetical protein
MAAHKGPASLRPRCTRSGSSVAAIPVYQVKVERVLVCIYVSSYAIMAFTRILLLYLLSITESWNLFISGSLH